MKVVIQRVLNAEVSVEDKIVGSIQKGYLLLVGVGQDDTKCDADLLAKKISGLRIFEDENGKTNLSISDVGGEILSISQFTLFADCSHGRRPSFINAGKPDMAAALFDDFNNALESQLSIRVQKGVFGADMKVSLINDGPFTILLDSKELCK